MGLNHDHQEAWSRESFCLNKAGRALQEDGCQPTAGTKNPEPEAEQPSELRTWRCDELSHC